MLRALVVDDEPTARRGLRMLLAKDPEIAVVGEAGDGAQAVELITSLQPEVVFLDVQMPEADGFEVLRRINGSQRTSPIVVFITAYDEYALKAFEVNAVDYLLKPYEDARLQAAIQRAKREVRKREADDLAPRLRKLLEYVERTSSDPEARPADGLEPRGDRILLKSSGEILFLKPDEIDWIEAEGDYMKFHVGGKTHLMRETMARLEERLDGKRFVRIHRSTIVNIDRVRKLSPSFAGDYAVILADGTKLKLSRGYQERLQTLMRESM